MISGCDSESNLAVKEKAYLVALKPPKCTCPTSSLPLKIASITCVQIWHGTTNYSGSKMVHDCVGVSDKADNPLPSRPSMMTIAGAESSSFLIEELPEDVPMASVYWANLEVDLHPQNHCIRVKGKRRQWNNVEVSKKKGPETLSWMRKVEFGVGLITSDK